MFFKKTTFSINLPNRTAVLVFLIASLLTAPQLLAQAKAKTHLPDPASAIKKLSTSQKKSLDEIVIKSYKKTILPYSSDSILTNPAIRKKFAKHCNENRTEDLKELKPSHFCWRLLTLRKAGKLPKSTKTLKRKRIDSNQRILAEIAARGCEERLAANLDRILIHAEGQELFAKLCKLNLDSKELPSVMKTALGLRKARRLRPELIRSLIQWKPEIRSHPLKQLATDPKSIPELPGIYIFRDDTGYLYIGEAKNLRKRLTTHLTDSDREALSGYFKKKDLSTIKIDLHVFSKDSPGKKVSVRRAYESELIRSRKPKFNIRP